jgi:glycerol-3-phosphate dehydrogenase
LPERVDITIIGGGVSGVALARECARARKTVLLVERHDFASGTTSRCTRIVQGGLQYLEQGELSLLRESLRGREALLREQPLLVQPLDFILAVGADFRYSALEIRTALWLYRKLGRVASADTKAHIGALRRGLDASQRWALYPYLDAHCEFPERLVADWLVEACADGVIARNHAEVLAIRASEGRVRGVLIRDRFTGQDSYVESEWVINASGPWADRVRDLTDLAARSPLVSGVRTSHIMLRRWQGAPTVGLHTRSRNGHPISISPWNGMLQVGATAVIQNDDPSLAAPSGEEVGFLLNSVAALFPNQRLSSGDIVFTYAGVRPLAYLRDTPLHPALDSMAFRHVLHNHADEGALGMLSIFGGTLSSASSLARKTAHTMGLRPDRLPGTKVACGEANGMKNTLQQWARAVHIATGIPQQSAGAVAQWHGRHAMCVIQTAMHDPVMRTAIVDGRPQIVAQAVEAVAYEHAVTLGDILLRRVPMALDQDWNEDSTVQAATRIAPALNWNERRIKNEIEAFEDERNRFLYKPIKMKPDGVAA